METNHYQYITEQIEQYSSKPLREAIFFVIKNAIIEGILLPGDRLTKMISPSNSIVAVHRFVKLLGNWKICFRLNPVHRDGHIVDIELLQ
jgi:predicted nucleotidyltransferase